jgi:hypothetical protein
MKAFKQILGSGYKNEPIFGLIGIEKVPIKG